MMKRWCRFFMLLSLFACSQSVSAGVLQDFVPGSYHSLLKRYAGQPFLLVFWSIDCPPCHKELAMLAQWHQDDLTIPLVLVATDGREWRDEVVTTLQRYHLADADIWHFASEPVERLRFEVEPAWRGELPRSYLFDMAHQRSGVTGMLERERLDKWRSEVGGRP